MSVTTSRAACVLIAAMGSLGLARIVTAQTPAAGAELEGFTAAAAAAEAQLEQRFDADLSAP